MCTDHQIVFLPSCSHTTNNTPYCSKACTTNIQNWADNLQLSNVSIYLSQSRTLRKRHYKQSRTLFFLFLLRITYNLQTLMYYNSNISNQTFDRCTTLIGVTICQSTQPFHAAAMTGSDGNCHQHSISQKPCSNCSYVL